MLSRGKPFDSVPTIWEKHRCLSGSVFGVVEGVAAVHVTIWNVTADFHCTDAPTIIMHLIRQDWRPDTVHRAPRGDV